MCCYSMVITSENDREISRQEFEKEIKKLPGGRIFQIDYLEKMANEGKYSLAIRLAEEYEISNLASDIALKYKILDKAIDNALRFFKYEWKRGNPESPLNAIKYLERRGIKNFSEWENSKKELVKKSIFLYNQKISRLKNEINNLDSKKSKLEKISGEAENDKR